MSDPRKRGGIKPPLREEFRRIGKGIGWGLKGIGRRLRNRVEK